MRRESKNAKIAAAEWADKHPSAVADMVSIALDALKENTLANIVETMNERKKEWADLTPNIVTEILRPHIDPTLYVKDRATILFTKEQKEMMAELDVEPKEFVAELIEWYRTEVFIKEKNKEKEKEDGSI